MSFDATKIPFGKIGLGLGALGVLGFPVMLVAMWNDVIELTTGVPVYFVLVLLTSVSVIGAYSNRAKARAAAMAAPPEERAVQLQRVESATNDTRLAAAGGGLAIAGCGAMAVVTVVVLVVAMILFAVIVWWFGKYVLGLW